MGNVQASSKTPDVCPAYLCASAAGKTEMDGAQVEGEFERGNLTGIAEYCMSDNRSNIGEGL